MSRCYRNFNRSKTAWQVGDRLRWENTWASVEIGGILNDGTPRGIPTVVANMDSISMVSSLWPVPRVRLGDFLREYSGYLDVTLLVPQTGVERAKRLIALGFP